MHLSMCEFIEGRMSTATELMYDVYTRKYIVFHPSHLTAVKT